MEFHYPSFSSTLATIFFVAVIYFVLRFLNRKSDQAKKETPKAKGAWPIIGHLHFLGGPQLPHHVLNGMAEKYGPIFTIKLGAHPVLVVSDAKIAKECFTTNDRIFASRPKMMAAEIMGYNFALLGLAPYGEYWRQVRKMLNVEVLSTKRVEMLEYVRVSELKASLKDMYQTWQKNKVSSSEGGNLDMVKVELSGWLGNMILNVVLGILSGRRFHVSDKEGIRSRQAVRNFFKLLGTFVVSDLIPLLNAFDVGGYKKKMKMAGKEMDEILEGWLKEHKRQKELGMKQEDGHPKFIDIMISILQDASEKDFPGYDHDTVIKAVCLAILVGASDSSSVTLAWALSLLLNDPKALKTAQDEIDEHVGRERLVEQSDTKKLVYIQSIVKETLRLHPPGPLLIPHESTEDCVVSGYNIRKGTRLFVNLYRLQRDPNVWSDPNEFQPERFLADNKNIDVKGSNYELLPFGSGRRQCPGMFFALESLPFIIASLLQQFVITKTSDEPIDMSEAQGLTNCRATPLEVLIAPRLSIDMYSTD